MKKFVLFLLLIMSLFCFKVQAGAENFKVAIMKLPVVAETYKNLFLAIGDATGNTFKCEIVPPARAMNMLENKQVDIQAPSIKAGNAGANSMAKADFSTQSLFPVAFVLYTNTGKPLDITSIKNGNSGKYKIEADGSNINQFGFKAIFSGDPGQSFKKLDAGRIDGYIISQNVGDGTLKSLKLNKVRRQFWDNFYATFALQKGQAGGKLDNILADGIKKLRSNGKFEQIMGEDMRQSKFNNWQP